MGSRCTRACRAAKGRGSQAATREMQPNTYRACGEARFFRSAFMQKQDRNPVLRATLAIEWGSAPDGCLKRSQEKGGVPRKYPRERAMFVFMDRHLHVQCSQTRQRAQYFGYEKFECTQHLVLGKVDPERSHELTPRCRGVCERQRETHRAFGGKVADIAIECSLGNGIEVFIWRGRGYRVQRARKETMISGL